LILISPNASKKREGLPIMGTGKILVVDDDQNICELLRLYLEKEGYDVVLANDGK
jgi:DNA-binding NtrC family response regulator